MMSSVLRSNVDRRLLGLIVVASCVWSVWAAGPKKEAAANYHMQCGCNDLIYVNNMDENATARMFSGASVQSSDLPGSSACNRVANESALTIDQNIVNCRMLGKRCKLTAYIKTARGRYARIAGEYTVGTNTVHIEPVQKMGLSFWTTVDYYFDFTNVSSASSVKLIVTPPPGGIDVDVDNVTICSYCDGSLGKAGPELSSLVPSQGSFSETFFGDQSFYTLNVGPNVRTVTLTPTIEAKYKNSGSVVKIYVEGQECMSTTPSQDLTVVQGGAAVVEVTKTDATCATTLYKVNFNVVIPIADDPRLSELIFTGGTMVPTYSRYLPEATPYVNYVPAAGTLNSTIKAIPTAVNPKSEIRVNGSVVGSGNESQEIGLPTSENSAPVPVEITVKSPGGKTAAYAVLLQKIAPVVGFGNGRVDPLGAVTFGPYGDAGPETRTRADVPVSVFPGPMKGTTLTVSIHTWNENCDECTSIFGDPRIHCAADYWFPNVDVSAGGLMNLTFDWLHPVQILTIGVVNDNVPGDAQAYDRCGETTRDSAVEGVHLYVTDTYGGGGIDARSGAPSLEHPENGFRYLILDNTFGVNTPRVSFLQSSGGGSEGQHNPEPPLPPITVKAEPPPLAGQSITVPYTVSGTATGGGVDYTLSNGSLTFTSSTATQDIPLAIVDDQTPDGGWETVVITLGEPTGGAVLGGERTYTYTIQDDDVPAVQFQQPQTTSASEDAGNAEVNVTISRTTTAEIWVRYALTNGTATGGPSLVGAVDYVNSGGWIVFPANQTAAQKIVVPINHDGTVEADETFRITLLPVVSPSAKLGSAREVTWSIENDDHQFVVRVDGASGVDDALHDGSSWGMAKATLQAGIDRAVALNPSASNAVQVWVADGIYKPSVKNGTVVRTKTFQIPAFVELYGHFQGNSRLGGGETAISDRLLANSSHITTLSGDIDGDGGWDGNAYHVVYITGMGAVLDGFTVTGGSARDYSVNLPTADEGGGLYAPSFGSIEIRNCRFYRNSATHYGAAVSLHADMVVVNCFFEENTGWDVEHPTSTLLGGAIYAANGSSLEIQGTTFLRNGIVPTDVSSGLSAYIGGAIHSYSPSNFELVDCIFDGNFSSSSGGAVALYHSSEDKSIHVERCTFAGNTVSGIGHAGALDLESCRGLVDIANSVFLSNFAPYAGGVYANNCLDLRIRFCTFSDNRSLASYGGALYLYSTTLQISSCILWGNMAFFEYSDAFLGDFSAVNTDHSYIQQSGFGANSRSTPPIFCGASLPITPHDLRLNDGSPCINQGGPYAPEDDKDRDGNARSEPADIGAYEHTNCDAP